MDFEKLCAERYSLRKFSDRPVEAEKLEKVLEAGHNAPTAHNLQPQRILVMQSKEALEKAEECTACKFHPPVILVVAHETFSEMKGLVATAMLPLGYPAETAHPSRLHADRMPIDEMVVRL